MSNSFLWVPCLVLLAALAVAQRGTQAAPQPTRVLVLTDISSLTAGVAEPDDGQSVIRLMLYSNELEIEGLIASSNLGHGQRVQPGLIRQVVEAYGKVRPNLLLHDRRYPPAGRLLGRIRAGQPVAGPGVPVSDSIGEGKDTEASEWIIATADRPDSRPVWVILWGGSADLAQALWKVRETRSPARLRSFLRKLRVHSIGDQDSTGAWIKQEFPDLFVITRGYGIRGMYRGGDTSLVSSAWVEEHIRNGHGPLGALYPNYRGGDIWSGELGSVRGIKEGDSPSTLSLIPNGLFGSEGPLLGSWGGRVEGSGNRYTDAIDGDVAASEDPAPQMSAVYRWRPAFQADFQARLDWCVKPYREANHPPSARIRGRSVRTAAPGATLTLDARGSTDPDGDRLSYRWSFYPAPAGAGDLPILEEAASPVARLVVPASARPATYHVLLTVTDDGSPRLSRYARVAVTVAPRR